MRPLSVPSRALQGARPPLTLTSIGRRRFLHSKPYDVAVIGGGITGLTAAYRLSKDPSCSKITLYEKASRVGGWISSEKIPVPGGEAVFEYGPRTLKTNDYACNALIDLLVDLDLMDDVAFVSRDAPSAINRYLYYPDHLVRVPTPDPHLSGTENLINTVPPLLREPVFKTVLRSILTEPFKDPIDREKHADDESIKDFISRRFSPEVAENLVSAMIGGIYGGSIDRLSAQTTMGGLRDYEQFMEGIILSTMNNAKRGVRYSQVDYALVMESVAPEKDSLYWKALRAAYQKSSVLYFKDGMGHLTETLATQLKASGKVEFLLDADISKIAKEKNDDIVITSGERGRTHNRVIATHAPSALVQQLDPKVSRDTIANLKENNTAATIMVVNLYFDQPNLVPVKGFGYLIPRSTPTEQNPEQALGVIFGSEGSGGQDTAPGTKLTVMMGGYWWDGLKETDYPDHDTAVARACSLLQRHLGITDTPVVARTRLQQNAIPQYTVGHLSRMGELSQSVRRDFNKRLTLAGSWYGTSGVGAVDCIRQGYLAASFGVGARKLGPGDGKRVWRRFDYQDWELEGGLASAPIRHAEMHPDECRHF
ncbi:putative protoporphyrinogen oxidase [Aspergillus ellipticus CBS 707.79]|uniref:Protoporphyrinogen oxidase n=1 Tax=Aspergillus ellipticus CBS 707.79 TaxID=1448320 RepID=A0A319CYK0_9EURO|nr:putative protoporphyrinogen oxidase [Aspergillus ellipticus CBS 707.79]